MAWLGESFAIHALTVDAIGGLTLGMMTRTARGHTAIAMAVMIRQYPLVASWLTAKVIELADTPTPIPPCTIGCGVRARRRQRGNGVLMAFVIWAMFPVSLRQQCRAPIHFHVHQRNGAGVGAERPLGQARRSGNEENGGAIEWRTNYK